ncbi:MAG: hypothetical protein HUJ89_01865 [Bacteroidales bacterium]|nr:hypothetical protein [Bacteroidales bacterium]
MINEINEALAKAIQSFSSNYSQMRLRYSFLCVKAEAEQLLSVQYEIEQATLQIEDMAEACIADDYTFHIFPKEKLYSILLPKAIKEAHPDFKVEFIDSPYTEEEEDSEEGSEKSARPKEQILAVGVPDMTDELCDLYTKAADYLYNETKAAIDLQYSLSWTKVTTHLDGTSPEFVKSLKEDLDLEYDIHKSQVEKLHERKLKEIKESNAYYKTNGKRPLYKDKAKERVIEPDPVDEDIQERILKKFNESIQGEDKTSSIIDESADKFQPGTMIFN